MIYTIDSGVLNKKEKLDGFENRDLTAVFKIADIDFIAEKLKLDLEVFKQSGSGKYSKLEIRDNFSFINLNIPKSSGKNIIMHRVVIYIDRNRLLFFCQDMNIITEPFSIILKEENFNFNTSRILYALFDELTINDSIYLDNLEKKIFNVENALIEAKELNYVETIIDFRRKLMVLKQYYEQFYGILQGLVENENDIIPSKNLKGFKLIAKRLDRLCTTVLNLRESAAQVREAYQAQVDISLNRIMKVFTVLTAIFSPLTLIVGWYGMNLEIPEYSWKYGYLYIVVLSICTVTGFVLFFKKHKWF